MIGRVFDDRYEILRRLGTGGMAEVYLAHDRHLDRDVALKILLSKYTADAQFVERFRREASHAAGLNHPTIVQIYDRGEAEGTYYIAMEYLEGRTLKDLIVNYAPLRPDHVASVATQILEALRFAHKKGVIHRDIKPQNIIVDDDGRVKVTDFGIARAANSAAMTETGSILGTAHYLSPEQAQGRPAEASTDLYSLGIVMYEMATGRLPFTGDNPVAIAMQHVHDAPVLPSAMVPGFPQNLERVILHAMAKTPEARYRDEDEFLEDLRRVENGLEVAPPISFADQQTQMMGVAGAGAADLQQTQVRRAGSGLAGGVTESPPPVAEKRRRSPVWIVLLALVFALLAAGGAYALFLRPAGDTTSTTTLVEVPSLVGMTQSAAETLLRPTGLKLEVAGTEPSTQYAPGQVTRQEPAEATKLPAGGTVKVWTAAGQQTVTVPNVVGKTKADAATALGQVNLAMNPTQEQSQEPKGVVTRQEPAAGASAKQGDTVTVYVSSGPPPTTYVRVPDVVGRSQSRATAILEAAGFAVRVRTGSSSRAAGEVFDQSPAGGDDAPKGSTVTITVSSGPKQVTVPDVTGRTAAKAASLLEAAGLVADQVDQPEGSVPAGTVFMQDPSGGASAKAGSTVKIVVAQPAPSSTTTTGTTTTGSSMTSPPST